MPRFKSKDSFTLTIVIVLVIAAAICVGGIVAFKYGISRRVEAFDDSTTQENVNKNPLNLNLQLRVLSPDSLSIYKTMTSSDTTYQSHTVGFQNMVDIIQKGVPFMYAVESNNNPLAVVGHNTCVNHRKTQLELKLEKAETELPVNSFFKQTTKYQTFENNLFAFDINHDFPTGNVYRINNKNDPNHGKIFIEVACLCDS